MKTDMHKTVEEQERRDPCGDSSTGLPEQSERSQAPSPMPAGAVRRWHFTIDVDWVPGSEVGLEGLLEFCDRWNLKATIFVAGRFAEAYATLIGECRRRGHEIGTHGWEHGGLERDEDFRSASYARQRDWIRLATEAVEKASGVRPVVFRAPSLWIGETTVRALEDEGYQYDSSVPARRFDCGFGRVHYLKYFRAPTEPYRLSSSHLCLRGRSAIIEMAPSAFLFPINMATLRVLGLPVMKWMVRRIVRRSPRLVFYCHPHEFVSAHQQTFPHNMSIWNMQGMSPRNFSLLHAFVEHMVLRGHESSLFADSLSGVPGSAYDACERSGAPAIDRLNGPVTALAGSDIAESRVGTHLFRSRG
ncbi:polysaccharide deacetylase family protein [Nitrospira sp. NS4]|uniref:polysaccharide deacetylase family protein n=1 Tax=Nitrospira sp. NS4 TaxID=3414498 RepID=UPI003C2AF90A